MKKLIALSVMMVVLSIAVSAQIAERTRKHSIRHEFRTGDLTRPEAVELRRDQLQYNTMQRRAKRDGIVTPYERRKLHRTKVHNRREAFRFKHNRQRRVI
ncbi:MAG TPA: hypothetical protein VF487_07445 [Chitinophagaceae bacterium]